ncbi:sensor histidine kinase [Paenibacillus sp. GCM10023248]|uniref:cache domain-containing sensor histidine kinase n=1 Tax=Bacillales TaxID=1385 RepID=UPI002378EF04|nr:MULTISPECIES: sensor histidine kinase [Bacillales]MDD9265479.1 sensor histidine kinase [Paenibacillus sp. MAHUQ-63]MDR6882485.1 two-component system sensor histidine kinase YesM [Bacillus sp. 3255]
MKKGREAGLQLFKFRSIQSSISVAFSLLILGSITITSFISYHLSAQAVEGNSEHYISEIIQQVNSNIQSYITNMENIGMLASANKDVKYYISGTSFISEEERRPYEKRISDLFQSILISRKDIASIMIFGYNGRFVSDRRITSLNENTRIEEQPWYQRARTEGGKSVITAPHVQNIIQNEYRWVVSLSRELKNADGITGDGIFLVDLNLSVINEICNQINLGPRGYVFIVDKDGNIVYHPQQKLITSNLKTELIDKVRSADSGSFVTGEGNRKRIYSIQEAHFGWKIVGVAYASELIANQYQIKLSYFLWTILALVIALYLSFTVSRHLSRPIKVLQSSMKQVEKGNFDIRSEIHSENEIGQLGRAFNMMVGRIKDLMSQLIQNEEVKRKSEMKLLEAQINPHFLYNTLDSIIWMAECKKHEEVVLMTSSLAKLFRAIIHKNDETVPVRVELEHITNYLQIQKLRYKDNLDFAIDVDPDILEHHIPKIILQPIVENAIYHGIKNKLEPGVIRITGKAQGEAIVFVVADNGVGMEPDKLNQILKAKNGTKKGIGVSNVDERIKLFGHEYGISFNSERWVGTEVTIVVPLNARKGVSDGA